MTDWLRHQRIKGAARSAADMFTIARAEAIRTGSNQIVFFGVPGATDTNGTALTDSDGNWVPVLILDDGAPATANCQISVGNIRSPMVQIIGLIVAEDQVLHNGNCFVTKLSYETRQLSGDAISDDACPCVILLMSRTIDFAQIIASLIFIQRHREGHRGSGALEHIGQIG